MATPSPANAVHPAPAAREESKGGDVPRWIYGGNRVVEAWALPSAAAPQELKKVVEEKLAEIKQWAVDDKVFMAQSGLTKLKEHLSSIESDSEEVKALVAGLLDQCTNSDVAKETAKRAQSCTKLLNEFYNHEGWNQSHDSDGIQTYYRAEPGTGTHSFKLSGTIPAPLLQLAACLYEVDLFGNWFPMLKSATELANPSRFRKLVHMEVSVPWPVWNRDVVSDCFGVDLMEEQKVLINVQSIDSFPQLVLPGPRDGVVRCHISLGGFLIEPLTKSESRFQMIMNADPQLPVLPYALLNWFTSKVIHYIIVKLRTAANFPPTHEYQKRIDSNPAMYQYLKGVIDAFFPDQAASS